MQYNTLDNLAEIRSGFPFRGRVEHDPAGNMRVLQIRDLRRNADLSAKDLPLFLVPDSHMVQPLQPDDIVLPARGDFRQAIRFALPEPTIASSHLHTVHVSRPDVLPAWLCWALNQPEPQHAMQNEARGTAMPLLTRRSLGAISIPVPTLATQRKIVELHELGQREQELARTLLANSKALLNGMIQQLMNNEPTATTPPDGDPQ